MRGTLLAMTLDANLPHARLLPPRLSFHGNNTAGGSWNSEFEIGLYVSRPTRRFYERLRLSLRDPEKSPALDQPVLSSVTSDLSLPFFDSRFHSHGRARETENEIYETVTGSTPPASFLTRGTSQLPCLRSREHESVISSKILYTFENRRMKN